MVSILFIGFSIMPIIIISAIILLVTRKSGESFEHKIRTIYCYIMILASIIGIIICAVLIINNITNILFPNSNDNYVNRYYRYLTTAISTVIILVPTLIYHKKKIK